MTPQRLHCFQHLRHEGLASIGAWAARKGYPVSHTYFYERDVPLPSLDDLDWLVVMGGTMGTYEEERFPWLRAEKAFIREAIDAGKTVLGICLGAQLIANALGARVYPSGRKEIGWWPVRKNADSAHPLFADLPAEFVAFHWHGDTFDLPAGAVHLARSAACANQAYAFGERVLALQFHFEVTPDAVRQMLVGDSGEFDNPGPYVQLPAAILDQVHHAEENTRVMAGLLDKLDAVARLGAVARRG